MRGDSRGKKRSEEAKNFGVAIDAPHAARAPIMERTAEEARRHALKGTVIVTVGVLWLTPDSLLVKIAQTDNALSGRGGLEVLFWRLLFYGLVVAAGFYVWTARTGREPVLDQIRRTGKLGLLAGFVQVQTMLLLLLLLLLLLTSGRTDARQP